MGRPHMTLAGIWEASALIGVHGVEWVYASITESFASHPGGNHCLRFTAGVYRRCPVAHQPTQQRFGRGDQNHLVARGTLLLHMDRGIRTCGQHVHRAISEAAGRQINYTEPSPRQRVHRAISKAACTQRCFRGSTDTEPFPMHQVH